MREEDKIFSYARCFSIIYRHGKTVNDKLIKEYKLSGLQHQYLEKINDNPGISQENLAKLHKIDKGAVAKALKRMEELGYIRREQNPSDKRAYCLFPTEKAQQICRECHFHVKEMEEKMTEGMTEEEKETLNRLLIKVTDNMESLMKEGKDI